MNRKYSPRYIQYSYYECDKISNVDLAIKIINKSGQKKFNTQKERRNNNFKVNRI